MSGKGKKVIIEGVLYEDDTNKGKSDIYSSKEAKPKIKTQLKESVSAEVTNQATQSTVQAVISQVQTQAASLGASGMIAVGSAGAFQIEHINDNYTKAIERADPVVKELVDTGITT
jgi:hypothetical protein